MTAANIYAVYFHPQALEALGAPIKPYLSLPDNGEPHVRCSEVDTGGAFIEMTLVNGGAGGKAAPDGGRVLELMVPTGMVRMIVSLRDDRDFGFTL